MQNRSFAERFYVHIFSPLYLASLAALRHSLNTTLVSRVSALFLLSQFFRVIHDAPTVQNYLTTMFFGDQQDIRWEWIRSHDTEASLYLAPITNDSIKTVLTTERYFFI
jgi:hypothetical protein